MYPNQPTPPPYQPPQQPVQPQVPLDYLNQIASTQQKKSFFNSGPKKLLLIVGIVAIVVLIASIFLTSIAGSVRRPTEQLSAKMTSTSTIAVDAQARLKNSQLRSLNSDLRVFFTNTNRDLTAALTASNIDPTKLSSSVTAEETANADGIKQRLEDARLNVRYDETYAREMAYEVSALLALMQQVYQNSSDDELKTVLDTAYKNLEPMQQRFYDFNDTKS